MERIRQIQPPDERAAAAAKAQWDSIAKPLGSFGLLEEAVQTLAAVQGTPHPDISRRTAVVLCADHGVVCEGVSQTESRVTALCAGEIAAGRSNVNMLADAYDTQVVCVDMGMLSPVPHPAVLDRRIAPGTRDLARTEAMTEAQTRRAVCTGMDIVRDLKAQGVQLILTGEMGIGNTTAAAAMAAALLGLPPQAVTGRGAGLSDAGLARKQRAVAAALALHHPTKDDPMRLLRTVGGLEIAGMTGLFLGGAFYRIPVVIDGVISAAAAAVACLLQPLCRGYLLASHTSGEPAGEGLLAFMGLRAPLSAGLRLGEGTGAMLLVPLLDGALALYRGAHRFSDLPMERYQAL